MYSKQKALNFGNYVPNDKVLNKKVPENPKYKNVKSAIDTGKSVRKHIEELKDKQKSSTHRKDEVFKRIKFTSFIKLALAIAEDSNFNQNSNENDMVCQSNEINTSKATLSGRKCITNVLMGVGELDVASNRKRILSEPAKPIRLLPYLLLDVRDEDAFSQCHIKTAKHYPSAMLSRSTGYEIENMKLYKNSPHSIIVLYDDDEVIATRVATTLVERGYENVFLLIGGLKLALEICPHRLTTSSPKPHPMYMLHHSAANQIQRSRSSDKEYFSRDDIIIIRQHIDSYPFRDNSSLGSQSSHPRCGHRHCLEYISSSSYAPPLSCRGISKSCSSTASQHNRSMPSSVSSKSSKQSQPQLDCPKNPQLKHSKPNVTNDKVCKLKRAPWK